MSEHNSTENLTSTAVVVEPGSIRVSNGSPSFANTTDSGGNFIPYGTRSRNRAFPSRPNYAEDREIDIEFEGLPTGNSRRALRASDVNPNGAGKPQVNSRKTIQIEYESIVHTHNTKEPIPGTLSFSANPSSGQGPGTNNKKRKAMSQMNYLSQANLQTSLIQSTNLKTSPAHHHIAVGFRETNMMGFEKCGGRMVDKKLVADDGTVLQINDHVYLVCEPPGEPYYLGRIMEFLHTNNDNSEPIDALRLNWFYRPKDIGRKLNDTRQVFASMHSDISPLTSLRGKCQIKHKSEIEKLDDLTKIPDCFWYEKLYDRYIHRFYDVIPTNEVINVPVDVKKVLDERWKYILVEPGRGKDLTSAVKSCKRCNKYCASNDSVDCAVCESTYHMICMNPPLLKKPSRGFAWACGPCSKAQEKKLEARNIPNINDLNTGEEEEELIEEEVDSKMGIVDIPEIDQKVPSATNDVEATSRTGTTEQTHQPSLWLFRYLGIHCKVQDALDYDDRIYPRASSRLGPRHQANVPAWYGRPVQYVKPPDSRKKTSKSGGYKKDTKLPKDPSVTSETDKNFRDQRPKWVLDEPLGYFNRGEDYENITDPRCTSRLLYKLPEFSELPESFLRNREFEEIKASEREKYIFEYMSRAAELIKPLGLPSLSTNFLDVALETLHINKYDSEKALLELSKVDRKIFKEPELSAAEIKKFEDGVGKYGSEWYSIKKYVKTVASADIVRFYYTWKKTERGKLILGNYSGRKGKKEAKKEKCEASNIGIKLQDDVADEHDDSAFDNDKAFKKKKGFQCKFCNTRKSRQWRRAPNTLASGAVSEITNSKSSGKDKGPQPIIALCRRCAELWRRYAIQWEDVDEMIKRLAQTGGRSSKRKVDEELLKEITAANEITNYIQCPVSKKDASLNNTSIPLVASASNGLDHQRKKIKTSTENESSEVTIESVQTVLKKKFASEKPVPPSLLFSEPSQVKIMPCAICDDIEPLADQHLSCKDCRMVVHRNCYGIVAENRSLNKWTCDMCSNDKNPQVSVQYKCMLCPVEFNERKFTEPSKSSSKKKMEKEKDRVRDRFEREHDQELIDHLRIKQIEMNKPVNPRQPLKRTANNNWIHVTCAVFTPEVKFGNSKALEPSEGIPLIPASRYQEICSVCKSNKRGACVSCQHCHTPIHVECAHQAGYILGFELSPVRGSRRDQSKVVNIDDEVGIMTAAIWCKEHPPNKSTVYQMHRIVNSTGLNALQLFVQNFKQADLALTGTARKATLISLSTNITLNTHNSTLYNRRASSNPCGSSNYTRKSEMLQAKIQDGTDNLETLSKKCVTCNIDVSPKWWPYPEESCKSITSSIEINGENDQQYEKLLAKRNPKTSLVGIGDGNPAALAAAALERNSSGISTYQIAQSKSTEYQCHKCHWMKVEKKNMTSLSLNSVDPLKSPFSPSVSVRNSHSRPPPSIHLQNGFPSDQQTYNWSHRSPVTKSSYTMNKINGNCSPKISAGVEQISYPSHSQTRQNSSPNMHQNSLFSPLSNGILSSQRSLSVSDNSGQKSPYVLYSVIHQSQHPHHLVNGGSPPRASELLLPQPNEPIHQQHRIASSHQNSLSLQYDIPPRNQDQITSRATSESSNIGVINGGASASPSLRNLLH